jgi:hypothetical protein
VSTTPGQLFRSFIAKIVAITLAVISVGSGLLSFFQVIPLKYLLISAAALLGLAGWSAAIYVAYANRASGSPVSRLIRSITERLPLPYLETWLASTVLNREALDCYWHTNATLSVSEITCSTELNANDAALRIRLSGVNAAREPASDCPMLMFGGSVIHYANFPQQAVSIDNGTEKNLFIRSVLDLGVLHYVQMTMPSPIRQGERFTVEHRHSWPGGMADGEDTLWYPYPALFKHRPGRMIIEVDFPVCPAYLTGIRASLKTGKCETADIQPVATGTDGTSFQWVIEPVDHESLYALVFKR